MMAVDGVVARAIVASGLFVVPRGGGESTIPHGTSSPMRGWKTPYSLSGWCYCSVVNAEEVGTFLLVVSDFFRHE